MKQLLAITSLAVGVVGCGAPEPEATTLVRNAATIQDGIFSTFFDVSGRARVSAFLCHNDPAEAHPTVTCPVRSDFVVIGGSAHAPTVDPQNFLTASYPNPELTSWTGSSKDHIHSKPHRLSVFALGMSVVGMTPQQLRQNLTLRTTTSEVTNHPRLTREAAPAGTTLIGMGAKVNWSGMGNLLTAVWHTGVRGKDHIHPSPASITMYEIYINQQLPVGRATVVIKEAAGDTGTGLIQSTVTVDSGFAPAGAFGFSVWSGAGRLLNAYGFHPQRTPNLGYQTWTTDHIESSVGQPLAAMSMIRID